MVFQGLVTSAGEAVAARTRGQRQLVASYASKDAAEAEAASKLQACEAVAEDLREQVRARARMCVGQPAWPAEAWAPSCHAGTQADAIFDYPTDRRYSTRAPSPLTNPVFSAGRPLGAGGAGADASNLAPV